MELAVGMFALALIVSVLCVFARYIAKSLEIQNHVRSSNAVFGAKVEVDKFVAETVVGDDNLHISEPHGPTDRNIP